VSEIQHQIEITITEHGRDPESGDSLVSAFYEVAPEADAVSDQNTATGTLAVTFVIDAENVEHAVRDGFRLFATAAKRAQLKPTKVIAVHGEACAADDTVEREAVPA
jgi:hypothetical protein